MEYKDQYDGYRSQFELALREYLKSAPTCSNKLFEACSYSLLAGGKRLRPVLTLAVCDTLNGDLKTALSSAIAQEMIHTYSLIHDDLPAMDNDDYRRGRLTNHKVFGEALAVLAGDALLNKAYEILFSLGDIELGKILSSCAGDLGMIGGQALDLEAENSETLSKDKLFLIHSNKTGKLIVAALLMGQQIALGKTTDPMRLLGEKVGLLFQVTDDILDVTGNFDDLGKSVGKDEAVNKLTTVKVFGLEGAKNLADKTAEEAIRLLPICGLDQPFFRDLITKIRTRTK